MHTYDSITQKDVFINTDLQEIVLAKQAAYPNIRTCRRIIITNETAKRGNEYEKDNDAVACADCGGIYSAGISGA